MSADRAAELFAIVTALLFVAGSFYIAIVKGTYIAAPWVFAAAMLLNVYTVRILASLHGAKHKG